MNTNRAAAIVVCVDYRLEPEHRFPIGLNDWYAASNWVIENAFSLGRDTGKVVVAVDSAGGNLAARACLMTRDSKRIPHIAVNALVYQVSDFSNDTSRYSGVEYGPSKEEMDWYAGHYFRTEGDALNPLASPIIANLKGIPPCLIVTAQNDPLREQDLEYARKLEISVVEVTILNYIGMVHGFFTLPTYFESGELAINELAKVIRSL